MVSFGHGRIALVPLEGIARCLSGDMELPEPAELRLGP